MRLDNDSRMGGTTSSSRNMLCFCGNGRLRSKKQYLSLLGSRICLIGCLLVCKTYGQELCSPDTTCNDNRVCEFGSLESYDVVRDYVFAVSGCSTSCINECTCVCNTSGIVFDELNQLPYPPYCSRSEICNNALVQRAMNYDTGGYACEAVFAIAMRSIYQLCAQIDNTCADGACSNPLCSSSKAPVCEQATGVPLEIQLLIVLYVIASLAAWQLSMSATVYFRYVPFAVPNVHTGKLFVTRWTNDKTDGESDRLLQEPVLKTTSEIRKRKDTEENLGFAQFL